MDRALIVNADDLGRSAAITAGIFEAHEAGVVTSASLMVRWDAAREAAEALTAHPRLSVGLHLDLGEWAFIDGEWVLAYEVTNLDDGEAVDREIRRQLERFQALTGHPPTHLDTHQHVHIGESPVREAVRQLARELAVPLRHFEPAVRYRGDFYGRTSQGEPIEDAITVDNLVAIIDDLEPGITELACHPGTAAADDPHYGEERVRELAVLTDPRVREAIERNRIELISFASLTARLDEIAPTALADVYTLLRDPPRLHDFRGDGDLAVGGLTPAIGRRMIDDISSMDRPAIIETGAGLSTLLFCSLDAERVTSIAPDQALLDRIRGEAERRSLDPSALRLICGRSDLALPPLAAANERADVAFIDGDHGWPSVFVDFCYLNMMLRAGGLLYIDDIQMYPIKQLVAWLREQPGFSWQPPLPKLAVFRKETNSRFMPGPKRQPFLVAKGS